MHLENLLVTLNDSSPRDWQRMQLRTIYDWTVENVAGKESREVRSLVPNCHDFYAVYNFDVDVALAWGAALKANTLHWMKYCSSATPTVVQLRYRGNPVYLWRMVLMENNQILVPEPQGIEGDHFIIDEQTMQLARLFFQLHAPADSTTTLDEFLIGRGIPIVNHVSTK